MPGIEEPPDADADDDEEGGGEACALGKIAILEFCILEQGAMWDTTVAAAAAEEPPDADADEDEREGVRHVHLGR